MKTRSQALAERAWRLPPGLDDYAVTGDALLAEDTSAPNFAVRDLLEVEDVALLSGQEKLGLKTWLLLDLAIARILGTTWLGFPTTSGTPGRVLMISAETRTRALMRRLRMLCNGRGVAVERIAPHLVVIPEPVSMLPREVLERARWRATAGAQVTAMKAAATHSANNASAKSLAKNAEAIGDGEAQRLGRNVEALEAIRDAANGTWSLILIDTLRQCLEGDDNSSADAARYTQATRDLARAARCPVVSTHHNSKAGDPTTARSARGSTELTAGPDVLLSVDAGGEYPTMYFTLRNNEAPAPIGYALVVDEGAARIDVRPPCGKAAGASEDEVLAILREHAETGLSLSKLRSLLASARGGAKGAKANLRGVQNKLDDLVKRGLASKCWIQPAKGDAFDGYRAGPDGGTVQAKRIVAIEDVVDSLDDPEDV